MAAALLAKLKINKPPAIKKDMEIMIKGKAEIEARKPEAREAGPREAGPREVEAGPREAGPSELEPSKPEAEKKVEIIDATKKGDFDRATFLKSFQKPKVINTLAPAPLPVPAPVVKKTMVKKTAVGKTKAKAILAEQEQQKEQQEQAQAEQQEQKEQEQAQQQEQAEPASTKKAKTIKITTARRTKNPVVTVKEGPLTMLTIGDADIETRLKKKTDAPILIPASAYYMNNREIFVNFMASLFSKYKKDLATEAATPATCPGDNDVNEFSLMTHQQIVKDYLNLYTPYRGLLLYHGLGSGKTCSSIAIAEGLKSNKQIIVMTPASLQVNYREELKKCGDELYKKNQFWEFIHTQDRETELVDTLSGVLGLSVEYIHKQAGAWMVNMSKPSNYDDLSAGDKMKLDNQIEQMIAYKYKFINYNGLRATKITEMTKNNTINPFDNAVVIVDEAHNLVSRIVNKIGKKKTSIAISLYSLLMKATNAKIVLLTGTPVINYPNEIAILYNILRGYITTWSLKLDVLEQRQVNTAYFHSLFKPTILGGNILDFLEYKPTTTTLEITRNPFGFVNKAATKDNTYAGMKLEIGERGEISDGTFIELVTRILKKNNIALQPNGTMVREYKALPDTLDEFKNYFIEETGALRNMNMFKRRILGLTSYFRSAQESLMPRYKKENPADFQVIKIPMSDFQIAVYEEARVQERNQERKNAKKKKAKKAGVNDLYENTTSTYRIFSRAFCNFVFPRPSIMRPMPDKKNAKGEEVTLAEATELNENDLDAVSVTEKEDYDEDFGEEEGEGSAVEIISYKERIKNALAALEKDSAKYLTPDALQTYSPKFLHILENIQDDSHPGIHLIYTQFRALEGIGILKLVLEANGFTQFKIKKTGEIWELAIPEADMEKPTFALYTGTETAEEKEIIRNVLNNAWKYVPDSITRKLKEIAPNNTMGEIIKVLMITSSGAEGISLKNVRYVHITEPYWHPVRIEQVIGRARRICSHQGLPEELRTVTVFLYLMVLSETQLKSENTTELRLHDKSRKDNLTPVTTDETLYEIASAKEEIANNILKSVKEVSIDCALHSKTNTSEKLQCFTFGLNDASKFAYEPSFQNEQSDEIADRNKKETTWKAKQLELGGVMYALNTATNEVYDLDSYKNGNPIKVGDLIIKGKGEKATYKMEFI